MKTLIIEDEPISAQVIGAALKQYGPVSYAASPIEAFDIYNKALEDGEPFNLICLDLELPEYDGLEFLDEIRKTEEEQGKGLVDGTKVIVVTGHSDPETFFEANSIGCDAFLTKPLNRAKLESELQRLGIVSKQ